MAWNAYTQQYQQQYHDPPPPPPPPRPTSTYPSSEIYNASLNAQRLSLQSPRPTSTYVSHSVTSRPASVYIQPQYQEPSQPAYYQQPQQYPQRSYSDQYPPAGFGGVSDYGNTFVPVVSSVSFNLDRACITLSHHNNGSLSSPTTILSLLSLTASLSHRTPTPTAAPITHPCRPSILRCPNRGVAPATVIHRQ